MSPQSSLSEQHLNIPVAIARKYASTGRTVGLSIEDLESEGYEALVVAWSKFDVSRSPNGKAGLSPYLVQRVEWAVRNVLWPDTKQEKARRATWSLDSPMPNCDTPAAELVTARQPEVGVSLEAIDLNEAVRRLLPARDWTVLCLRHREGLTLDEVAARLNVSRGRINQIEQVALAKVRRSALNYDQEPATGVGRQTYMVGDVVVRKGKQRGLVRYIKVCRDGPVTRRWALYARWLYEKHIGPVPSGKNVIHLDGNTMNDDLGNLGLGNASDRGRLWKQRAGQQEYRQAEQRRIRACVRSARQRVKARNALGDLRPTLWYLVCRERRVIWGPFGRRVKYAWHVAGLRLPTSDTIQASDWVPARCGWSMLTPSQALVLAALCQESSSSANTNELFARVKALTKDLQLAGKRVAGLISDKASINQPLYELRKLGLVVTIQRGTLPNLHRATEKALLNKGSVCKLLALTGIDCRPYQASGYQVLPPHMFDKEQTSELLGARDR